MQYDRLKNPSYWLQLMGGKMYLFQCEPNEQTRAALTDSLRDYQREAASGLQIPRTTYAPLPRARNLAGHYRRDLDEAMGQFRIKPEGGFEMLEKLMTGYINAVQQGQIKP